MPVLLRCEIHCMFVIESRLTAVCTSMQCVGLSSYIVRVHEEGSVESASQVQDSFHESGADSRSKSSIDPFQDEDQLATAWTVEQRICLQTEMFDIFDRLVDNEQTTVDACG